MDEENSPNLNSPYHPTGLVVGLWYHVVCWYDSVNNQIGIVVNNGVPTVATYTGNYYGTVEARPEIPFFVGYDGSEYTTEAYPNWGHWKGQLDEIGFWKRKLTETEIGQLYNEGYGFAYPFGEVAPARISVGDTVSFSEIRGVFFPVLTPTASDAVPVSDPFEIFVLTGGSLAPVRISVSEPFPVRDRITVSRTLAPNLLLADLVAYWPLDEASGNALDSHGDNHLTDTNTVTSASGKVNTARSFAADSSQYFTRTSGSDLSTGDIDFTISVWFKLGIGGTPFKEIISKWTLLDTPQREFELGIFSGTLSWYVRNALGNFQLSISSSLTTGVWYHVVCWHDSVNNQMGATLNNGAPVTTDIPSGPTANPTGSFTIGGLQSALFWDGQIDEAGFWKRLLLPAERTELYNDGNGLEYSSFTGGIPVPTASDTISIFDGHEIFVPDRRESGSGSHLGR